MLKSIFRMIIRVVVMKVIAQLFNKKDKTRMLHHSGLISTKGS